MTSPSPLFPYPVRYGKVEKVLEEHAKDPKNKDALGRIAIKAVMLCKRVNMTPCEFSSILKFTDGVTRENKTWYITAKKPKVAWKAA